MDQSASMRSRTPARGARSLPGLSLALGLYVVAGVATGQPTDLLTQFREAVAAGEQTRARKVGALILKREPDSGGSFFVVRQHLVAGWKLPRIATSYDTLRDWSFEKVPGDEPDLRLLFLDLLRKCHPREKIVTGGGIHYSVAWCHWKAGRYTEAVKHCQAYLQRHSTSSETDKVRFTMAESLLELDPPRAGEAIRQLEAILAGAEDRLHARARQLLERIRESPDAEGAPSAEGLGAVVLLTDLAPTDPRSKALAPWIEARHAQVLRFRGDITGARAELARLAPEFVAIAVAPEDVDINYHLGVVELCRGLDADPMPDFHFGYLCARDAGDLGKFVQRILAHERRESPRTGIVSVTAPGTGLLALDGFLHFGHGQAWRIEQGLSGEEIAQLPLERGPVVFSGACFNGVLSRSYHGCALKLVFLAPETIAPEKLVSLGWVHAGATALLAALEGDRGEMAMAEWQYLLETAAPLGEVIGHQYRLVFTRLPESFASFPRYEPGKAKRMGYFDVMLRGQISRLLLSDPSYRPFASPLEAPTSTVTSSLDPEGSAWTVRVVVDRIATGAFTNTLPESGDEFSQHITARLEVPDEIGIELEDPRVEVSRAGKPVELGLTTRVRRERWGGRSYVTLQAEAARGLQVPGTRVEWKFRAR